MITNNKQTWKSQSLRRTPEIRKREISDVDLDRQIVVLNGNTNDIVAQVSMISAMTEIVAMHMALSDLHRRREAIAPETGQVHRAHDLVLMQDQDLPTPAPFLLQSPADMMKKRLCLYLAEIHEMFQTYNF